MNVDSALPAQVQPAELMQPAQAPLDDPARLAELAAVLGVAMRQHRGDPTPAQLAPMGPGIVRAIALHAVRSTPRESRLTGDGRDATTSASSCVTS